MPFEHRDTNDIDLPSDHDRRTLKRTMHKREVVVQDMSDRAQRKTAELRNPSAERKIEVVDAKRGPVKSKTIGKIARVLATRKDSLEAE